MQLTRKYSAFASANWDKPVPVYNYIILGGSAEPVRLYFDKTAPYTRSGFRLAVEQWRQTKLLHWAIAQLYIAAVTPCAALPDEVLVPVALTFDDVLQYINPEVVAEGLLEGIIT